MDILSLKTPVWEACLSAKKGEGKGEGTQRGIEVARFNGGMFMNYLAFGWSEEMDHAEGKGKGEGVGGGGEGEEREKERRKWEVTRGFVDEPLIWDTANQKAELPVKADGTFPRVSLTDIGDIGRFVAGACALPLGEWEESMEFVGEVVGVDEVVRLLERRLGRFEVSTVTKEELERRVKGIEGIGGTREEVLRKMGSQIELVMLEEEEGASVLRGIVNEKTGVKGVTVDEYLERVYGGGV